MEITIDLDFLAGIVGKPAMELTNALKLDEEGNPTAEKSEVEATLRTAFEDKLKKISKDARDEGHGRGKRETLDAIEKDIADEFELEKMPIKDMFAAYANKIKESGQSKEIDPNDVRNHDVYQSLKKSLESKIANIESQYSQYKNSIETERITNAIREKGRTILNGENYQLPENEEMQKNLLTLLVKEAISGDGMKFNVDDTGIRITDAEGRDRLDDQGNPVTFESYFNSLASNYLPKREGNKRETPGGNTTPPGSNGQKLHFPQEIGSLKQAQEYVLKSDLKPDEKSELLQVARERFSD